MRLTICGLVSLICSRVRYATFRIENIVSHFCSPQLGMCRRVYADDCLAILSVTYSNNLQYGSMISCTTTPDLHS